ncbi:MAG: exonuclease subunit SbcD, partial [Clostridia bacterium]|nr:exonuclease subunit SbcD [Clostridia bacterium]
MKFLHLADLHLGKRVNEFSMLEEQSHILDQVLRILEEERPDGLLLAGDIYDKPAPSAEAVALFDSFLSRLAEKKIETFLVSGNHDSPERLAYAADLIVRSGIHVSPVYHGEIRPILLRKGEEKAAVFLLPFLKQATVRRFFPDREIGNETDAVRAALAVLPETPGYKRILV